MRVTHNKLNEAIVDMEFIVRKGQPFAKANKDRNIRAALRWMRREQAKAITLEEVLFYFWLWIKSKFKHTPVPHQGDPCIFCGAPHDEVEIGDCPGR